MISPLTIGLPRMHQEQGEKRDFLPEFIGHLNQFGPEVYLEEGYGSGMGYHEGNYLTARRGSSFHDACRDLSASLVLVLRYPGEAP